MSARDRAGALAIGGYVLAAGAFLVVAGSPGSPALVPSLADAPASAYGRIGRALAIAEMSIASRVTLHLIVALALTLAFVWVAMCARRNLIGARTIVALAIGVHIAVLFAPVLFSRDVYSYAAYGRIATIFGENPYLVAPSRFPDDAFMSVIGDVWRDEPTVYGPAFTLLSASIAGLARDAVVEVDLFRLVAAAAALGTLPIVRKTSAAADPTRTAFALTIAGLTPVLPFLAVAGGHNDPLVALAAAGGLWVLAGGRPVRGVITWTLGALVKLTGAIALVVGGAAWLGATPPSRRANRAGVVAASVVVTSLVVALPFLQPEAPTLGQNRLADRQGWISAGRALRDAVARVATSIAPSAEATVERSAHVLLLVSLVATIAWIAWIAYQRAGEQGWSLSEAAAGIGLAFLATLLLSPASPPWYAVWVLPFVWVLRPAPRAAALIWAAVQFLSLPVADAELFPDAFRTVARIADGVLSPAAIVVLVVVLRDVFRHRPALADPALAAELSA